MALLCCVWLAAPPATAAEPRIEVLFVGNSYTSFNDLPQMLTALAKAGGKRLRADRSVAGGFTLQKHWEGQRAARQIAGRRWDYVVLQEQSQLPVVAPAVMFEYAKKFDAAIDERGAKTIFFLTWARANAPDMQAGLNQSYFAIAKECEAEVAPVGLAWQQALTMDNPPKLHQADNSHPTPAGTYLAACVFYGTIFGESPEGLRWKPPQLPDPQAGILQHTAWQAVTQN
ncbi:MAG: DUF4886 domain-containing protein [Pirellulales bacterium]